MLSARRRRGMHARCFVATGMTKRRRRLRLDAEALECASTFLPRGVHPKGGAKICDGIVLSAQALVDICPQLVRRRICGAERYGVVGVGKRCGGLEELVVGPSARDIPFGVARCDANGFCEVGDSPIVVAQCIMRGCPGGVSEIVV